MFSYWEKSFFEESDFVVIGAGIVGLSTALHLKRDHPKRKVLVLESGSRPSGASTKNAGFACFGSAGEILDDLNYLSDREVFDLVAKRLAGLKVLRAELGDKNIGFNPCGGYELLRANSIESQNILNNLDSLNHLLNPLLGEEVFRKLRKPEEFGFKNFKEVIYNPFEGGLNPVKLMETLASKVQSLGVAIRYGVKVEKIDLTENRVDCENGIVLKPRKTFITTNGFAKQLIQDIDLKPARAQVLITKPIKGLNLSGTFHFDRGYYYFRNVGNRILFGGGRNLDLESEFTYSQETTDKIQNHLEDILRRDILPGKDVEIDHRWAGTMGVGSSKTYLTERVGKRVFLGVRLGGMGVALGILVGKELSILE